MSYQVLARKWRPRSFAEMVGQEHVLRAMVNALDRQRLHHAYLFTGTRGVGKTTIARILAKCLNCETGITSQPCGACSVCREIDEGRFIDLIEVDAASRTGVDDIRELLDNVQYAPGRGRFKVYLIDEVHMLSKPAFNALLKTLEEPPEHVKFLLATTDPQKLPVTILSRCLQFALKGLSALRIKEHLQYVLGEESIPYQEEALWLLGRAADGSMRDALSLTDQAIAFGNGRVFAAEVRAMLGSLDQEQVSALVVGLHKGDAGELLEVVQTLAEQAPDWSAVLGEMLELLHRIAVVQVVPEALDNSQGDREAVQQLARRMPPEDVQFYYQMGLIGRRDLPLAPEPRGGFEMVLLRMLAFRPADTEEAPGPSLDDSGVGPATADPGMPKVAGVAHAPAESRPAIAADDPKVGPAFGDNSLEAPVAPPAAYPEGSRRSPEESPEPGGAPEPAEQPEVAPPIEAASDDTPRADSDTGLSPDIPPATGLARQWLELFPQLGLAGLTANIASHCTLLEAHQDDWHLLLDSAHSALFNEVHQQRLQDALSAVLGRPLTLRVDVGRQSRETPALAGAREQARRLRQAEEAIRQDPLVQRMIKEFAAQVCDDSIQPLGN